MQVRAIEFQENFRSVTIEASRQHNLLLREAEAGQQQASTAVSQEQTLNLTRPRPTAGTEEGRIVDAEEERNRNRSSNSRRRRHLEEDEDAAQTFLPQPRGTHVDLTA